MKGFQGFTYELTSTKQLALIFDKIVFAEPAPHGFTPEIDWLMSEGIIANIREIDTDSFIVRADKETRGVSWEVVVYIPSIYEDELGEENKRGHNKDFYTRSMSLIVKDKYGIELCPIVNKNLHSYPKGKTTKDDVINVVLNTIPVPDESTPWEHILEYRADIDSHNKFLDLRNWMNELARAQLSPMEVEQKLEYLMSQYERHMRLHKMKTNAGTLETVVVSSAEFCEDLVRFKWGKIAKSLFSIKHRRIALMEGELTSPGSEVAYVIKAKESFPEK